MDIVAFLNQFAFVPDEQMAIFSSMLHEACYKKHEYFVKGGEQTRKAGFVTRGLFRLYRLDRNGKEYTKNFSTSGNLLAPFNSLLRGAPSNLYIEALEDSTVLEINYDEWIKLLDAHLCWQIIFRKFVEYAFLEKEQRESDLLLFDAEMRYINFANEFPDLMKRVKQHHIASFLGMSPETLSRIKKQIADKYQ